jgi:hypothetical protein
MKELRTTPPARRRGQPGGYRGVLTSTTQRRYLDPLGELLQAAVAEGRITTNWVHERTDLPAVDPSPTKHLELWEVRSCWRARGGSIRLTGRVRPSTRCSPSICSPG